MRENYNQDQMTIAYEKTGRSTNTNELGMREMQARVYERRQEQYLLVKATTQRAARTIKDRN